MTAETSQHLRELAGKGPKELKLGLDLAQGNEQALAALRTEVLTRIETARQVWPQTERDFYLHGLLIEAREALQSGQPASVPFWTAEGLVQVPFPAISQ